MVPEAGMIIAYRYSLLGFKTLREPRDNARDLEGLHQPIGDHRTAIMSLRWLFKAV